MGAHDISQDVNDTRMRKFVRSLLEDVRALERMLDEGMIEGNVRRIGAEQEVFLVNRDGTPANSADRILERLQDGQFTSELALYNLEVNLEPLAFGRDCLSRMESDLLESLDVLRTAADAENTRVAMCGILPTLDTSHVDLEYMTPRERYYQLNKTMVELRGGSFKTWIKGLDELHASHDSVMLEACNTSFQVHFQVGPKEFPSLYNLAQVVTAPVLAAATNSPVLLQHRLWHETRVALFQQSIDVRSEGKAKRGVRQRVSFGETWVRDSVLEIFREDIARFRSLIAGEVGPSPLETLDKGEIPDLGSLRLHNGTVYRWNRPCYGISEGRPHLRIENRVLPAGPTVCDQIANAAFYFGLMSGLDDEYEDVTRAFSFDDAKANFLAAARYGMHARFRWSGGRVIGADTLILDELLPRAQTGLASRGIDSADIDRFLGIIRERVETNRTGSQWALDSLAAMGPQSRGGAKYRALVSAMIENQSREVPVAQWPLAELPDENEQRSQFRTVGQLMTTDLFTLHPEDIVDLAATLMDWEHLRHVPVEDDDGALVGIVSYRELLRVLARGSQGSGDDVSVKSIMKTDVITVEPKTSSVEALETLRNHRVGSLPVVEHGKLVGLVTESDFLSMSEHLLTRWLKEELNAPEL